MLIKAVGKTYAKEEGPYQAKAKQIYTELRDNVVNNVFKVPS
jgi:mannosyl-oligosaccharide glucosidase